MPHIRFTVSNLKTLSADKTTWFTDLTCKGLRLCVTKGGVKTWYVSKWDPTSRKTRSVKLAQWANKGPHCRWAKEQVGKVAHDITTGNVRTREEHNAEQTVLGIPKFRDALEQYITHRTTARASGRARIINLLRYHAEKILLLNATNFRGDYPVFPGEGLSCQRKCLSGCQLTRRLQLPQPKKPILSKIPGFPKVFFFCVNAPIYSVEICRALPN